MKWQIVEEHRPEFMKKNIHHPRKAPGRNTSSAPNSPFKERPSSSAFDRSFLDNKPLDNPFSRYTQGGTRPTAPGAMSPPPQSSSPPNVSYKREQATTPERASNHYRGGLPSSPVNFMHGISPFPEIRRPQLNGLNEAGAARTPAALAFHSGDFDGALATPLIGKHIPRLAPPSTAQLPSQYMPFSSPAPFWKFTDMNSSPAKPMASSPVKFGAITNAHQERESKQDDKAEPPVDLAIRSSSPPAADAEVANGSPTGARSGRARSASQAQTIVVTDKDATSEEEEEPAPPLRHSTARLNEPYVRRSLPPPVPNKAAAAPASRDLDDDDEEAGHNMLDLARGFQGIGSFHRNLSTTVSAGAR